MKKLLVFHILFCLSFAPAIASDKILNSLKEGGNLIFIRHALAPGNGDPDNFNISDCSTQRNLNAKGISQSKRIGLFFKNNNISIDKVLSSEWCRCKDTARIAFGNFQTFNALNSFYEKKFADNELKQLNDFYKYIENLRDDKNLIFVTHYVVILSILGVGTSSGEIIITDQDLNIISRIEMI